MISDDYVGPLPFLDKNECSDILKECIRLIPLKTGKKNLHSQSKKLCELAARAEILQHVRLVLGDDIALWGSELLKRSANHLHPWHLDVEMALQPGATVWIALQGTEETQVKLITHSHGIPSSPNQLGRMENDADMLEHARRYNPTAELKIVKVLPGSMIAWNARTWHSTETRGPVTRYSLIFQYCRRGNPPRHIAAYDYPNTKWLDSFFNSVDVSFSTPEDKCLTKSPQEELACARLDPAPQLCTDLPTTHRVD